MTEKTENAGGLQAELPKVGGKFPPPVETRFTKGTSGNPVGKKKGTLSLVTKLKKMLAEKETVSETVTNEDGSKTKRSVKKSRADILLMNILVHAIEPNLDPDTALKYFREICDRVDGKPTQELDHKGSLDIELILPPPPETPDAEI
jgi:hypothetical protein